MDERELNKAIDYYFALDKKIKATLGWVDDWKIIPLYDVRDYYWMLTGGDKTTGRGARVVMSKQPFTVEAMEQGSTISDSPVYTQRNHDRWIYRASGIVLVSVDTRTDGNIFLQLHDANKEVVDAELEKIFNKNWGCDS